MLSSELRILETFSQIHLYPITLHFLISAQILDLIFYTVIKSEKQKRAGMQKDLFLIHVTLGTEKLSYY